MSTPTRLPLAPPTRSVTQHERVSTKQINKTTKQTNAHTKSALQNNKGYPLSVEKVVEEELDIMTALLLETQTQEKYRLGSHYHMQGTFSQLTGVVEGMVVPLRNPNCGGSTHLDLLKHGIMKSPYLPMPKALTTSTEYYKVVKLISNIFAAEQALGWDPTVFPGRTPDGWTHALGGPTYENQSFAVFGIDMSPTFKAASQCMPGYADAVSRYNAAYWQGQNKLFNKAINDLRKLELSLGVSWNIPSPVYVDWLALYGVDPEVPVSSSVCIFFEMLWYIHVNTIEAILTSVAGAGEDFDGPNRVKFPLQGSGLVIGSEYTSSGSYISAREWMANHGTLQAAYFTYLGYVNTCMHTRAVSNTPGSCYKEPTFAGNTTALEITYNQFIDEYIFKSLHVSPAAMYMWAALSGRHPGVQTFSVEGTDNPGATAFLPPSLYQLPEMHEMLRILSLLAQQVATRFDPLTAPFVVGNRHDSVDGQKEADSIVPTAANSGVNGSLEALAKRYAEMLVVVNDAFCYLSVPWSVVKDLPFNGDGSTNGQYTFAWFAWHTFLHLARDLLLVNNVAETTVPIEVDSTWPPAPTFTVTGYTYGGPEVVDIPLWYNGHNITLTTTDPGDPEGDPPVAPFRTSAYANAITLDDAVGLAQINQYRHSLLDFDNFLEVEFILVQDSIMSPSYTTY
jgi:hypothetical protein